MLIGTLAALVILGSLTAVITWRRRWLAREADYWQGWIKPPRPIFATADERLPEQARWRRAQADLKRREAAQITSASAAHGSKLIRFGR